MYRSLLVVILGVMMVSSAYGQDEVYTIESEGIATVDIAPTYIEFWLHSQGKSGADVAEAVKGALAFEPGVRKELQDLELTPMEIYFSGVAIPDVQAKKANISARIRFKAAFANSEEGLKQCADLCDKIVKIGADLGAQVKGPILGVTDPGAVQDAAVKRAIEKAYPLADAASASMKAQILTVSKVDILSVTWNNAPEVLSVQPELNRLTCTAKVRVTYMFNRV